MSKYPGRHPKAHAHSALILLFYLFMVHSLFMGPASGQASELPLEYERLPELLRERSARLQGSKLEIGAAEAREGFLPTSYFPELRALGGVEAFRTGPFGSETQPYGAIEASVSLYHGGRDSLEERKRRVETGRSRAAHESLFREELLGTRLLYWDLVFERQRASVVEKSLARVASGRAAAQRRAARGITTQADAQAFDLYSRQLRERIENAKHAAGILQLQLRARLDLDPAVRLGTPETPLPHLHDETLLSPSALPERHPELWALNAEAQALELASRQLARWWTPSVEAYGTYALYTLRDRTYPSARERVDLAGGLRIRLNLFDGFRSGKEADSASLRALAAEKEALARQRALSAEIEVAQARLRHLHELIHSSEETVALSDRLLDQTVSEYDRGLRSSQDVLSGIERLVSLRELSLERLRDYQKSKAKLLSLTGEP